MFFLTIKFTPKHISEYIKCLIPAWIIFCDSKNLTFLWELCFTNFANLQFPSSFRGTNVGRINQNSIKT